MKFIYIINSVFYGLTLIGYLTIIYGLYMQILLGIIQVILFLVLLFNYKKFSNSIQQHLITYGVLTTIYLLWFFSNNVNTISSLLPIMLIPMLIGTYFTYIVYQLKQQVL